jgi:hypothetical protein
MLITVFGLLPWRSPPPTTGRLKDSAISITALFSDHRPETIYLQRMDPPSVGPYEFGQQPFVKVCSDHLDVPQGMIKDDQDFGDVLKE